MNEELQQQTGHERLNGHAAISQRMVIPREEVRDFLINVIQQGAFPGQMAEFVVEVKAMLRQAEISG